MHTPVEVTEKAMAALVESGADGLVAIGGGSAVGLSKALALRTGLKHVVIPTTYAGSEMTPILGQTQNGEKIMARDARMVPQGVIYDVALTLGLPVDISMTSGLNAMAHAVEALYAPDRNRLTSLVATEAISALISALRRIHADPQDREARLEALYGAWFAGQSLAAVTMGLHHKLAHVLGGLYDLPHAPMHAVLLPHVVAFNENAAGDLLAPVARELDCPDAAQGLADLSRSLGVPDSLAALGMKAEGIGPAVEAVMAGKPANPREITREGLAALLEGALAGTIPVRL
jgi:alcohol dehydrogenase class IV